MSQLIPFNGNGAGLPSFLKSGRGKRSADDLQQGVGLGVVRLSIEGKVWKIVRGKEDKKPIMNPKDPESFASTVNLVIIKASPNLSRTFYEKGYEKGVDSKPDCASADGVRPDSGVAKPQAKSCAACPHAVYGSGQNGKGFRCANHRRLAVANPLHLEEPMLLQVPGASLKNLAAFADILKRRDVPYDAVITKFAFDPEEPTPKLMFEPAAFVSDEMYETIQRVAESIEVERMLGLSLVEDDSETPVVENVTTEEVKDALDAIEGDPPKKAAGKAKKAEPEPKAEEPAVKVTAVGEGTIGAPPTKSEPKAEAAEFGDELDDLLASYAD